jgi:hypothetical protein
MKQFGLVFISDKPLFNNHTARSAARLSGKKTKNKIRIRDLAEVAAVGGCGFVELSF